ncbi:MAG: hypothetical protein CMJ78_05615 [Planctomycetaceae bacterium]|nr:hypothetical protein [Planctomycetaceae bacterium]
MTLNTLEQQLKSDKKRRIAFILILLLMFFPGSAAHAAESKWYEKPFAFMFSKLFEWILEPFIGLHEPAYYIFYQGAGKIWGLYTQEQYNSAIYNGFNMMLFVVGFLLCGAIVMMGIQHGYAKFSSSMKSDITDNFLKVILGIVLLFQFFPLVNSFFTLNHYFVQMFETGITDPVSLRDLGATVLTSQDGKTAGEKIEFTDLSSGEGDNWIKDAIVSFFSLGVSIWFKAYYTQRLIMISGLILLAPVWISTIFFPKLQGITSYAMKELWAQTIAQTIHAAIFWLYFWLFDSNTDWLTYIIALSIFIPVSESLRFAMGATSESGGKLAMIGTAAGFGSLMHGAKAVGDIKNGVKNGYAESKGLFDGSSGKGGQSSKGNTGMSMMAMNNGKSGGAMNSLNPMMGMNEERQYGGAVQNVSSNPSKFTQRMRTVGHVAGGVGSAIGRMGGNATGLGVSPFGQHIMAEAGANMGQSAGYGSGVVGFGVGKGMTDKAKNFGQSIKGNFEENPLMTREQSREQNMNPFQQAGRNLGTVASNLGRATGDAMVSPQFRNSPQARRETLQRAGGVMGEALYGRGIGYQMGADAATSVMGKGVENPQLGRLDQGADYSVVTERDRSYLAEKGPNNTLTPISNYGPGDPSLPKNAKVMQDHKITTSDTGVISMNPTSEKYATQQVQSPNNGKMDVQTFKVDNSVKTPHVSTFIDSNTSEVNSNEPPIRTNLVPKIDEQPLPNMNQQGSMPNKSEKVPPTQPIVPNNNQINKGDNSTLIPNKPIVPPTNNNNFPPKKD